VGLCRRDRGLDQIQIRDLRGHWWIWRRDTSVVGIWRWGVRESYVVCLAVVGTLSLLVEDGDYGSWDAGANKESVCHSWTS